VFKDNEKSYNECFKTKLSVNNSFKMFKLLELIIYAIYLTVKIKQVLC